MPHVPRRNAELTGNILGALAVILGEAGEGFGLVQRVHGFAGEVLGQRDGLGGIACHGLEGTGDARIAPAVDFPQGCQSAFAREDGVLAVGPAIGNDQRLQESACPDGGHQPPVGVAVGPWSGGDCAAGR